jgi:hypothetical protein
MPLSEDFFIFMLTSLFYRKTQNAAKRPDYVGQRLPWMILASSGNPNEASFARVEL